MSRLDELIAELCPDGVEFQPLKKLCSDIVVPMRDRPKVFDGNIPWCRIEDKEGQYFNTSLSGLGVSEETIKKMNLKVFPMGTVICSCSASIGAYAINTQPLITNQTFIGLVCGERLFNKYLLYFMETQTKKLLSLATTGTIPYISRKKFEELSVPVPPLEVQREIVRVLDHFTLLSAELSAELKARKQQYEYYRNEVLSFTTDVEFRSLGELTNIKTGSKPKEIKEEPTEYEYINAGTINSGYTNGANYSGDTVTTPSRGQGGIGFVGYQASPFWLGPLCYGIKAKDNSIINNKYLYYCLNRQKQDLLSRKNEGGVPALNSKDLATIMIPVPNMEVQERVVNVLDNFESICSDLNIGIPAEIDARQKQYEYYRDMLLTFAETGETIPRSAAQRSART